MPRQKANLARHYPVANNMRNEAVLLVARGGRDHCFLLDADLAPRDKLGPAHLVGVACPAIFIRLHPDDVYLRSHQTLSKECTINNWMRDHPYTSLRGSLDNIMLLGAHHISCPGSGGRSTPRQNLIPARILCMAVQAGEQLPSLVGGGTVPTLPCDLVEQRRYFDVIGGGFVRVFVRENNTNKNVRCFCKELVMISFELPWPKRRSTHW